ncbi:MAG: hypothetical protein KY476_21880, partial [Planctomycetes bacterium]|nr:hypothetical protein [Planctomycetota bacterium]
MSAENHVTRGARATRLWTLAAVLLGGLFTAIAASEVGFSETSGQIMWYRGKCEGVAGRRVAVEANGSRLMFEVEPHARITLDREDATLDDLRLGQ